MLRLEQYPPNAERGLRSFSMAEVADYIGVAQNTIKKLHLEGKGPVPATSQSGRRSYTAGQMFEIRQYLDKNGRSDFKRYMPHRRKGEGLQIISVVNFEGGSGKTTTTAHLAQYLALTGRRVLAIDLDPQASLTSLHGIQPELDKNPSLYEALRYGDQRRSITEVIQQTNFPGLDIIPETLELQEYEYQTPLSAVNKASPKVGCSLLAFRAR
jgi:chromosome partitioning protein